MRKNIILLIIVMSLGMATALSAAPSMGDGYYIVTADVSPSQESHFTYIPETSQIDDISNSHLKAIGAEILKPPADFTYPQPDAAKTLPPVPAGLFMTLTGFLCVSFVKDRRVWLAALAGLLWAGQAGVQVIPQLAVNISKKHIQHKSLANTVCLNRFEDYGRLRSDIEGTQYIGLLRHLAGIPEKPMSLPLPVSPSPLRAQRAYSHERSKMGAIRSTNEAPQFAIIDFSSLLNLVIIRPAALAEQNSYFSPAFTFQQLPRGPPNLPLRKLLLTPLDVKG